MAKSAVMTRSRFFDFLNGGAGSTRQWDLIVRAGLRDDRWNDPFFARYAAVDLIYAAALCVESGISALALRPIVEITLGFSFLLNCIDPNLATQAIVREMVSARASDLDAFIRRSLAGASTPPEWIERCIASLPDDIRKTVGLSVSATDFAC